MSGVGGIVYDKDAVYIDLGGSHSHAKSKKVWNQCRGVFITRKRQIAVSPATSLQNKKQSYLFYLYL
jgi:hypothetical protein